MRILSCLVLVFMVASAAMKAQTFTSKVQSEVEGQGVFEIEQDPRLTAIVNGEEVVPSSLATTSKVATIITENKVRQDAEENCPGLENVSCGAVVCNCDPFTLGHRHLIEYAAANCDDLYVFAVAEKGSLDASAYMRKIKSRGISEAMVVKSEIYVTVDQLK